MADKIPATRHLGEAADLIRRGYCIGANARDGEGRVCGVNDRGAVAWSLGAQLKATGGDDFQCQTSDAFELVVMCLRDFHGVPTQENGWAAAIVLYEKQQVVIRQKDGPCQVTTLLGVGHLCPCRS